MTNASQPPELLELLRRIDRRLDNLEQKLGAVADNAASRETSLREELETKRRELESLGMQGLHVVEQLHTALERIKALEAGK